MRLISLLLTLFLLGCQPAFAQPLGTNVVAEAAEASYKIEAMDSDPLFNPDAATMWSGTAWKVGEGRIVTAGHVCFPHQADPHFRVYNERGQSWPATVVAYEFNFIHGRNAKDLCILEANVPGRPLKLGPAPAYGDAIIYVGAPKGVWGDGVKPFFKGHYVGGNHASIPGNVGASGSAMVGEHGVVGVLVDGVPGSGVMGFVPATQLRSFAAKYDAKVLGVSLR